MPWSFNLPMRGSLAKGWITQDRGCRETWKVSDYMEGVTRFLKELCSREGKVMDIFVLVISIDRWNQIHIGCVPWNNELEIIH